MLDFDQLPPRSRSLILATLALDIASSNCRNIFDLALKTNQSVHEVWRDICRRTAQPRCTLPRCVVESRYTATGISPSSSSAAAADASPAAAAMAASTAPSVASPIASTATCAAAPSIVQLGDLLAITPAAPLAAAAPRAIASRVAAPDPKRNRAVMLAGLAAILFLGIAFVVVLATYHEPGRMGGASRTVHSGNARSIAESVSVPPPEGTLRRMDAISKSFSKQ
jgi:hypothetical protein